MSIHVALLHRTHYKYDRPVTLGPQVVRLRPAPHSRTRILSYSLRVLPAKHFINWQQDPQSNYLARLVFPELTREFMVEVELVAEMSVLNPFDYFLETDAQRFPFKYDPLLNHELEPFRHRCVATPKFAALLAAVKRDDIGQPHAALIDGHPVPETVSELEVDTHNHGVLPEVPELPKTPAKSAEDKRPTTNDFLVNVNRRINQAVKYIIRLEPGVQTPEETLEKGTGSCRDSAWLLCQILRHCGLATRFVSGYLIQLTADVKSLDGPSGPEKDFTDLHAWCEVYLPGAGWIGLDATSGLMAGEGHIPLACAPDPTSAAPITGGVDECECEFAFEMKVTRVHESPRVTKPYTDEQWQAIEALGHKIDADLLKNDVRLTMGGEPTFVSIDDLDGAEWNTVAMGPKKRGLADELIRRLQRKWAPGALLHYGQGKWYPGEQLPRWAFACYWRKDGTPVWQNHALLADEKKNYGYTATDAAKFVDALAGKLGVDGRFIMEAFEDAFYYLWKERRLPINVDPLKSNLRDKEERARLARIFEQGLDAIVGYVMPLGRRATKGVTHWASGPWHMRDGRLYLVPGDSALGFRLPLDSQPWVTESEFPYVNQVDPTVPRPALPPREVFQQRYRGMVAALRSAAAKAKARVESDPELAGEAVEDLDADLTREPKLGESASWVTRTALCIEPRRGRLHIFMPPVEALEDYLELVAAIEDTAAQLQMPVMIEGYTPPHDPRVNVLKVTPDPGVIEVNLHPSTSWTELVERTTTLYAEARQTRLATEKFMVDGRHTGTGGGNHIIVGGATPNDSPLLRRPDLLRSLVTYWQNHPSLSFLFSGMFIGPTSQSPRVDEARNDSLYEMELAFQQLPERGWVPPWLVDRLFRHLLIDSTGNTHRAEFSIDKLYSPESGSGRLGLLEMRAFEMPPDARMSLAQHLLLRALVSRFWQQPYQQPLVRWGTQIHDRWMLPHFISQDLEDVVRELQDFGYPLQPEWFAPHAEFRFPFAGDLDARGLHLELRHALEPWHVLGEEPGPGGTVRYVDSSVERMQIKVQGAVDPRHVITVNGRSIPLHSTGTNGEFVAGVRYRAWQPASCLHPTIGVHTPLVFDVVDSWNERSLGGCAYHVMHPGGRGYTTFPVNSYEAESRRLNRFFRHGHTPGKIKTPRPVPNPEFPLTLDLRNG